MDRLLIFLIVIWKPHGEEGNRVYFLSCFAAFFFFLFGLHSMFSVYSGNGRTALSISLNIWKVSSIFVKYDILHSSCTVKYRPSLEMKLSYSSEPNNPFEIYT